MPLPERKPAGMPEKVWDCVRRLGDLEYSREANPRAIEALGPRAVRPLVEALRNRKAAVRYGVAAALGGIGHPEAILPLTKMLGNMDEERPVRMMAARALQKIYDKLPQTTDPKARRAWNLVAPHLRFADDYFMKHRAYLYALPGRITPANAELTIKQLRALKGRTQ